MNNNTRISQLLLVNPEWANKCIQFISNHPEFTSYIYLIPLTDKEASWDGQPTNVFDCIIYCLLSSGIKYDYALKKFNELRQYFINNTDLSNIDLNNCKLSPSKLKYIQSFIDKMNKHQISAKDLTYELFKSLNFAKEIKGIGPTSIYTIAQSFSNDPINECDFPITDRGIVASLKKIYGQNKSTSELKKIIKNWNKQDQYVSTGILYNIFNYTIK